MQSFNIHLLFNSSLIFDHALVLCFFFSTSYIQILDHVYYRWPRSIYRPLCRPLYRSTVDRLSGASRSTAGRQSTDCRPVVDRWSTDIAPDLSVNCRPIHRSICSDQLSVKCRPSIGPLSAKCRPSIGLVSAKYRQSIGQVSVQLLQYRSDEIG